MFVNFCLKTTLLRSPEKGKWKIMPDDIFILDKSGIPYYSKCFGGKTCKMRPDHTLQTGFLAALYAYSKESFG